MSGMVRPTLAALLVGAVCLQPGAAPQRPAPVPAGQTALDRYVAQPDPAFAWNVSKELPVDGGGAKSYLIDLTSQRWLTDQEVERPLWTHWLVVARPDVV